MIRRAPLTPVPPVGSNPAKFAAGFTESRKGGRLFSGRQ